MYRKYRYHNTFARTIRKIINGTYKDKGNSILVRKDSPKWMKKVGYKQLPMLTTYNHIKSELGIGKKGHQHCVSKNVLSALPKLLDAPIASYTSHGNSIVAILKATDKKGRIIIAVIKPNGNGYYKNKMISTNYILSLYGRNSFIKYYNKTLKKEKLLYPRNKTKKQIIQDVQGLQLSNDFLHSALK